MALFIFFGEGMAPITWEVRSSALMRATSKSQTQGWVVRRVVATGAGCALAGAWRAAR